MPKINRWFFGFLLAMLGLGLLPLHAGELEPDVASSQDVVSPVSEEATPGIEGAVQMAQEEVRDPFAVAPETEAPAAVPGTAVPVGPEIKVELQGIGFGSKDAYAVIGGEVFYKGDDKKGIKLLEVRRREVDILASGGKITVPLFPDQDLQRAKDRAKKKIAVENVSAEPPSEMPSSSSLSGREQSPL
ncbi:MAG: hypothetical protein WC133_04360 [Candidatus Omnitrophota bacterium]